MTDGTALAAWIQREAFRKKPFGFKLAKLSITVTGPGFSFMGSKDLHLAAPFSSGTNRKMRASRVLPKSAPGFRASLPIFAGEVCPIKPGEGCVASSFEIIRITAVYDCGAVCSLQKKSISILAQRKAACAGEIPVDPIVHFSRKGNT